MRLFPLLNVISDFINCGTRIQKFVILGHEVATKTNNYTQYAGGTIDLNKKDIKVIRMGLMELPAKVVLETLQKLDVQLAMQLKLREEKKENE